MWLFLTTIAIIVIFYNRNLIKTLAENTKTNGVVIDLGKYKSLYPRYSKKIEEYIELFNKEYQKTFVYEKANNCAVNKLFSLKSDTFLIEFSCYRKLLLLYGRLYYPLPRLPSPPPPLLKLLY